MRIAFVAVLALTAACGLRAAPGNHVSCYASGPRPAFRSADTALHDAGPILSPWSGNDCPFTRTVLDSFASPGIVPMGIDWVDRDGVLYHVDEELGEVYSISPDGHATYLFRIGPQIGYPLAVDLGNGICHVETARGEYLYITDHDGHDADMRDMVHKFELDGTLVGSWGLEGVADGVVGICFDGQSFWLQSDVRREIVRCDASFQETGAFYHPMVAFDSSGGLDYDPVTGLYYVSERLFGSVYVCDDEMNVVDFFVPHPTASRMVGLTVGRSTRGRSLWMSSFGPVAVNEDTTIYEVDDVYYNETAIQPSTWGSIKAMYR